MITLKTLPQATAQAVFDQAVIHLLTQGKRSYANGMCLYWDQDQDLKCAAGCFIAHDEYDPDWEDNPWEELAIRNIVPMEHMGLIRRLQGVHDSCKPIEWRTRLRALAISFELEWRFN